MLKRYSLSQSDCECGLGEFYENAAKRLGVKITEKTQYDCRKICVTKLVQDRIWKHYYDEGHSNAEIGVLFLHLGPKANLDGDALEFTVEDGFVAEGE